ncbi:MAG TPA: 4-hydroxy-tetrahydrodipicolinate synthase [Thermoanaerobaculia bacterium]
MMFRGCGTALVTPFHPDLTLDVDALRRLVRRQIDAGIHYLVPCGTTGENPTLNRLEHLQVVSVTLEEARGRVPVLAGAGGNNTDEVIKLAREVEVLKPDGLLIVTPYYNKPTPEGLVEHYRAISDATRLPIVVYSVPGRTAVNIDPPTVARLAQIDRIVGIKEASGNIAQVAAICQVVPKGFAVISGDDALTLPILSLGGDGVISVAGNVMPAEMATMTQLALDGDFAAARAIHRRLHALMEVDFIESSPGPVKAALALLGLIQPAYRLPVVLPRPESLKKVEAVLRDLGVLPEDAAHAGAAFGR